MAGPGHAMPIEATLAILAGGSAGRLGGTSKTCLDIGGRTILERLVDRIGGMFGEVLVCVKDGTQAAEVKACKLPARARIVQDDDLPPAPALAKGPILGLRSAVGSATRQHIFLVSGDMPLVPPPVIDVLAGVLEGNPAAGAVVPRWGNGYLEPTLAFYKVDVTRVAVDAAITSGTRQLVQVIWQLPGVVHVPVHALREVDPSLSCMVNVNDHDDLAEAMALIDRVDRGG